MQYYYILGLQISTDDIITLSISTIAIIVALIAFYYLYHASKVMAGGALKRAFSRIAISVVLMIYTVAFLVFSFGPFDLTEEIWVAFIGPSVWLLGNIFLLVGVREIAKLARKE
ncbi:hypothetical protein MYX07_06640 [Patescibacteria group bacterium AH-259-L07]|nr:hypothetical protein [Patescibacteria group bacterium AH-259-L07]